MIFWAALFCKNSFRTEAIREKQLSVPIGLDGTVNFKFNINLPCYGVRYYAVRKNVRKAKAMLSNFCFPPLSCQLFVLFRLTQRDPSRLEEYRKFQQGMGDGGEQAAHDTFPWPEIDPTGGVDNDAHAIGLHHALSAMGLELRVLVAFKK